ncbi:MAG TPA: glutaminyl-peptide cyclotransferase [Thermoanaerobaculia bacterium]|nr:glutaminyl-peptide cyclotransferase [Thermoanaerobaculia bacterium]
MRTLALILIPMLLLGCSGADGIPVYGYEVVRTFPHDPTAFTQGLVFHEGGLLESTGIAGRSSLRRVELETGRILKVTYVPAPHFSEGMTVLGGRIYQLNWQGGRGFVYDLRTLEKTGELSYEGEGWGLTHDGESLFLSDGTSTIRVVDPATFTVKRTIAVTSGGKPVDRLNELEFVKGEILANVWQTDRIARIDPKDGRVTGWIDLSGLSSTGDSNNPDAVLNGIAYDPAGDRLFVTGKLWPKLFEIKVKAGKR